jgi:hypothetical protein
VVPADRCHRPPGAGKTMALALWAAAEPGTIAWVSLDDYDNKRGVFWAYVAAALRRPGAAVPRALERAHTIRSRVVGQSDEDEFSELEYFGHSWLKVSGYLLVVQAVRCDPAPAGRSGRGL